MTDLVSVKFNNVLMPKDENDGTYGLFGFAVADYCAEYSVDPKDVPANEHIVGAILEPDDFEGFKLAALIDELYCVVDEGEWVRMFVFDINAISDRNVIELKNYIENELGFKELENVYEDRVVFVKEG